MPAIPQVVEIVVEMKQGLSGPPGPKGDPGTGGGAVPYTVRNNTRPGQPVPEVGDELQVVIEPGWYGTVQWRRGAPDDASAGAGPIVGASDLTYTVTDLDAIVALPLFPVFTPSVYAVSAGAPVGTGIPNNVLTVNGEPLTIEGDLVTVTI